MLNQNERKILEKQVLQYSLGGLNDFLELKRMGISTDSFKDIINKRVFESIELYIGKEKAPPEINQLFAFMIATGNNSLNGLAEYVGSLFPYSYQNIPVERLIADNIEIETKKIIDDNKNEYGLDYAMNINEQIGNIILKYLGGIKKEKSTPELLSEVIEEIKTGKQSEEYIPTGIKSLDKNIIGIPKKHITVIGAATGQGKTTFALQLKRNFIEQGLKVGMFSLEMGSKDLLIKDISAVTKIDSIDIENRWLKPGDINKIDKAEDSLNTKNFIINDNAYQTSQQIKTIINQWKIQKGIDVVIIDYLTLIKTNIKKERYDLVIGQLSNDLRIFAKDTDTPIIILSQLNRNYDKRSYSKPSLTDLKESSQIEQDAKLILLLYYPDKYGISIREPGFKEHFGFDIDNYRDAEGKEILNNNYYNVIIPKARSGRTGSIHLKYLPQYHKFEDITKLAEDNYFPGVPNDEFPI